MRDMPFTAVVLGGDMNCYGVARTFYEAYGIGTIMAGKTPIFPTAESGLVTGYYDRSIMEDEVLLRLLTEIQRDYPGKKKILLGSNDDYVRHIIHNRKAIGEISSDYIIPMISEELFDRLDDKDSFYEMCEKYGLPYPKSTVFDCVSDDPAALYEIVVGACHRVFKVALINAVAFLCHYAGDAISQSAQSV